MRNVVLISAVCAAVMACSPPVPDSAAGVGFENYDAYLAEQRAREAQGQPVSATTQTVQPPVTAAEQTAADAVAAVRPQGTTNSAASTATTAASRGAAQPNNPNISDEQDFAAVSSRRTIEDDAARVQEKRAQYSVVRPKAVPNRPTGTVQTPIQFALATSHPIGQKVYRRGLGGSRKAQAACASYDSAEKAQDQFLKAGGPEKDKLGLDPDGDGYACGWNPAVYRGLVRR